ncbi:MAG TPA: cytochrome c [Gammaproteobacteria bacterium]|nr:cytochrome c [Gammaproteobacteria bacterium]
MGRYVLGVLSGLVLPLAVALVVIFAGRAPVSALRPSPVPLDWALHTAYERTVARQAQGLEPPPGFPAPAQIQAGAGAFEQMCAACHTPPGRPPTVVSQGLDPPPPEAARLLQYRTAPQAFWVIGHGVRMSGMPAFGPTHTDAERWELVAFLSHIAGADAATYERLVAQAQAAGAGHGHEHGPHAH